LGAKTAVFHDVAGIGREPFSPKRPWAAGRESFVQLAVETVDMRFEEEPFMEPPGRVELSLRIDLRAGLSVLSNL
jgi:hypothetical protein